MATRTAETIVILSGDTLLAGALSRLLEARGFRVTCEPTMPADADEVACVIADLDTPPLPLSADWLQRHYPAVPCVILSGSPWCGPHAAAGISHGYFMDKPVPALDLVAMVEGVLHDGSLG